MIAEAGVMLLVLAASVALLQHMHLYAPGMRRHTAVIMPQAAWLQALLITLALASLIILRMESDFSVENVASHSNLSLPMLYKIVGAWGNHEGSMLLWIWVLASFGALLAMQRHERQEHIHMAVAVQSGLCFGTILFLLATSNPFSRLFPPPHDGKMLNPLLQDVGLAIHPPMLYVGYVGFSIVFSLAVAALVLRRADAAWATLLHPWILAAWSALTLGIGLGSWWAYRELGWGGWWFWDPVENASLLPWLAGTALLHSNLVLKKRGMLAQWVVLLAIMTFALSMIGTFLVRSGALTSVHSFASDPARGLFILGFIILSVGGALLLYGLRGGEIASQQTAMPVSREGLIILNNLFLMTACAGVLLGTLYPLFADAMGGSPVSVGPPYFNYTFLPLMVLPLVFAALAPFTPWGRADMRLALRQLQPTMMAAVAVCLLVLIMTQGKPLYAAGGFTLAGWLVFSSLRLLWRKPLKAHLAVAIAHLGAGVFAAGVTGSAAWKTESEHWMEPGQIEPVGGYEVRFERHRTEARANHDVVIGDFSIMRHREEKAALRPEYRRYHDKAGETSEAAIYSYYGGNVYIVIGEASPDKRRIAARLYHVPMIHFIWAGFVLMACGGIIAIIQRRMKTLGKSTF
ncbi:MAG: heme lyase NrfEFG subunit NrfE [Alphaproteobacteria bacterium]|nr:heme lyase NrfEFG subunit NrfE [Alphaproteobacteria bacterium]